MDNQVRLLTDQQVQRFIVDGYTIVQADYGEAFHAGIRSKLDGVLEAEGNLGNNILPRVPEIAQVFEHPNVRGALVSLLGDDYVLNPHRHCHVNAPGSAGQKWHKDCYVYDHNLRHPRSDWVLAFYYPQDTTEDMGASSILPGTQYFKTISDPDATHTQESDLKICGPAGTVALIHFDAWHRASANSSAKHRYMLKFQFARMARRERPSWDHRSRDWSAVEEDAAPEVSRSVWDWMRGDRAGGAPTSALADDTDAADEGARLNALVAYARSSACDIDALIGKMRSQSEATIEETTAKTPDNAHGTNPTPGTAALALAETGAAGASELVKVLSDPSWWVRAVATNILYRIGDDVAVDALREATDDTHWWVRRNSLEALGEVGNTDAVVPLMNEGLKDDDYRVRRNACIGLIKRRAGDGVSVRRLSKVLDDENRYNRFYAALALSRIDLAAARERLMGDLFTARWCPITTKDDRY